jgi:DNA mismatch repair ATPase MutL
MSPRRSSRARTTQPPPGVTAARSTTSSSASSSRARTNQKQSSPHKSTTPHSLSSEDLEEPPRDSLVEPPTTRRRAREHDADEGETAKIDDELEDEIAEEDEVTRCLCGQQEYPGPPSDAGKSNDGQPAALTDSDMPGDEAGGLFIQCDVCKVWQHGGCVGIMDEAASPDEYFCEECRNELHKVMVSSKGYVKLLLSSVKSNERT